VIAGSLPWQASDLLEVQLPYLLERLGVDEARR